MTAPLTETPAIVAPPATTDPRHEEAAHAIESARVMLHMPVDVRSLSLIVLATLACVYMLRWASAVCIPVMVGLMFSYALSPVVDWLQHRHVPRALSAALLILGIVSGIGASAYSLSDDASKLVELLPAAAQKFRDSVRTSPGQRDGTLATVQKAAMQIEQAAEESTKATPPGAGVQRVQIEKPKFAIKDHLWDGTLGVFGILGQIGTMALICFFLMASGDSFRRKLIKLAGPTLSSKKVTLQALNEINGQIQRYLMIQLLTSVLVGLGTWLAFLALGLEHAAVWGFVAGTLNLVPYIGSVAITGSSALVAFLQFGTVQMALLVGGTAMLIHAIESFLLMPWLTSRANKMNPVAVFVGILAWGWIWGIWGLLLAVPILAVVKAICDRIDNLKPVGEFLGA